MGASLPPIGLPGFDRGLSRVVRVPGRGADSAAAVEWHYVDTAQVLAARGIPIAATILAVHGNPTWSYLWRKLVTASLAPASGSPAWRVVAVDQPEMGFSERTGRRRALAERVSDLGAFTEAIGLEGPVVTLGHDWGGVISLGWAVDHAAQLAGVILLNTAVHQPAADPIPAPLRLARARGMLSASSVRTTAFLDTTLALASPALPPAVRSAFRAPYGSASRRRGIGDFVADIPVDERHPSFAELQRIAAAATRLRVPALLLWGPRDPIFSDRYLDDLITRIPHADVHRFEGAGHLLAEDRPYQDAVMAWLDDNRDRLADAAPRRTAPSADPHPVAEAPTAAFVPLWQGLDARREDDADAVIDMSARAARGGRRVSWKRLNDRVRRLASGLCRIGVRPGDRVSLLVQPGPTLTALVYACLRIGAIVVVADAGLGVQGLTRAVRGARPDFLIGETRGLVAARALGWPGVRVAARRLSIPARTALGVSHTLGEVVALGDPTHLPDPPGPDDTAAILFTSGSTGPAKGVVYTHAQLSALRDALAAHFDVTADTGLVTGFAPFALLGPALGTRSATPDMDVSSPRTLTATALAAAVRESGGRIVFLSPAAVLNVVATADSLAERDRTALAHVQTFLSTGAPIDAGLLTSARLIMPNAIPHTPYGMTECLLVTDITLDGIRAASEEPDAGVCVGSPIGVNRLLISALDADGRATGAPDAAPGVLGEIVISAPHLKSHYDRLWVTDRAAGRDTPADPDARWHRTGDVGHLDAAGRLWVEGRLAHVLVTEHGPVAPVGAEQDAQAVAGVRRAAVVGVGPQGLQQAVAVVETDPRTTRAGLADPAMAAAVRRSSALPLVAVLTVPVLPTDIRHNSKIDRTRLAGWAERVLAGGRPAAP